MFKRSKYVKKSYSQSGEDMIIDFIFTAMRIFKPSYVDIGAHHPFYLSNTAYFYQKGCRGICIEPDPILFKEIKKYRKKDVCLNVGIGFKDENAADFYQMSSPTLNTFSKAQASDYELNCNVSIDKVIKIKLQNINSILNELCEVTPNFVNVDVEGLDYEIISSFDFVKFRPEVFCIETLTYTEDNSETKIKKIIDFMLSNGYFVYADTYINTIFVDQRVWKNRK